jgi:hypothetical protein
MDASSFAHHIPRALRVHHFPAITSAFQRHLRGRLLRTTSALLLLLFAGSVLLFWSSGQAHAARPADATAVELNALLSNPATDWNGDGQKGVSDQWIELANLGGSDVDLTGFELLSQGSNNNQPTTVPPVQIGATSLLVIFIIQVPKIRLFPGGGELELLDTSGQTISSVNYPTLASDQSYNRDGSGQWQITTTPTPGGSNRITGGSSPPGAAATARSGGGGSGSSGGQKTATPTPSGSGVLATENPGSIALQNQGNDSSGGAGGGDQGVPSWLKIGLIALIGVLLLAVITWYFRSWFQQPEGDR